MTDHAVVKREEWQEARQKLLEEEQAHAARSEELAQRRKDLPWVQVDEEYTFDTDDGQKTLAELFDAARSCSRTTSCSDRATRRPVPVARTSPTISTGASSTSSTATSRCCASRGPRSTSCRRTSGGWAGASRGCRRTGATLLSTSSSG